MLKSITLSTSDHFALGSRLAALLRGQPRRRADWLRLQAELDRAELLPAEVVPANVVRIGSSFIVRDLNTDECDHFELVWPEQADVERGRLSVLAPLGIALLGYSTGDEISWEMPGGERRLRLESVRAPAARK